MSPWLALAVRIALVAAAPATVEFVALVAMGKRRRAELAERAPFAFAAVLAITGFVVGAMAGWDAVAPEFVGPHLASHAGVRAAGSVALGVLGFALHARPLGASRGPLPEDLRGSLLALVVSCAQVVAGLAFARDATALVDAHHAPGSLRRAALRLRVVPTDPEARLAAAYAAALADHLDDARRELALARGLGANTSRALEVEAEIVARAGDCEGAERLFRFSLESRGSDDPLGRRLDLRAYHLPPSLITRCRFGAAPATLRGP